MMKNQMNLSQSNQDNQMSNVFQPVKIKTVKEVVPDIKSIDSVAFMPTVVKAGKLPLPPAVAAMIPQLIKELNSSKSIIDFGEGATVKVSQFADKMLDQVSMMNIGDFQKPLTDILVLCGTVNSQSISSGYMNSRIPFMNRAKLWFAGTKARAVSNINSVRGQIDDITKDLIKNEGDLRKNIQSMEEMYLLNMQEYYAIMAHIEAIEYVMGQRNIELVAFTEEYKQSAGKDPLVALEIQNKYDDINEMDKKLYDLRVISLACLDTAPMIRNEQRSSTRSIEKFRNVRVMAIPMWKKQAMLMISSLGNARAAQLGNTIDDTTNNMAKTNADQVAANTVATAKLGERGVLDVETMEHVNDVLTKSINEMLQIADEGRAYRANAAIRFEELKQSLNQNVVSKGMS